MATKPYLLFAYKVDGEQFVEAYPTRYPIITAMQLPPDIAWTHGIYPSRTQARKAAYRRYVREDMVGFEDMAYRAYARKVHSE